MGYRVVVAGATGNVGREMLNILAEREFPIDEIAALASGRSHGIEVEYGETGRMIKVQNIEHFDFTGWDIALFAIGSAPTKVYAPKAAAAGCVVIDNSSLYRMDPDVPLIVPEVNAGRRSTAHQGAQHHRQPQLLDRAAGRGAEAAPRCREDQARRRRDLPVGFGRGQGRHGRAVRAEPRDLRRRFRRGRRKFTKRIAFNVDPAYRQSSSMTATTKEEWKMMVETKKILDRQDQA